MAVAPATRALAALTLLLAAPAQAGRFQHDLSAGLSADYDSNPALAASGASGIWRFSATPGYRLTGADGADLWSARLGLRLERSSDAAASADREDPSLSLSWSRQAPAGQFSLSASYDQASTRVTEFRDTGLVSADGTRTAQSLSASWLGELNERDSLSLTGSHADTSYSGGTLSDYANQSLGATLTRAWSERAATYLRLSASRYQPASGVGASHSYDALAGLSLTRSERLNLDLRAGFNSTSSGGGNGGWQGGATLGYDYAPRARLALDLGRSTASSGAGGFATADNFDGHWNLAVSERDSAGLDLSWHRSATATAGAGATTTRQFSLWGSRELSPAWRLRLSYLYKQRSGAGLASADAHVLGLALSYAHPDFPLL